MVSASKEDFRSHESGHLRKDPKGVKRRRDHERHESSNITLAGFIARVAQRCGLTLDEAANLSGPQLELRYAVAQAQIAEEKLLDLQVIAAAFVGGDDYRRVVKMLEKMING
jgi:hypothetical protein